MVINDDVVIYVLEHNRAYLLVNEKTREYAVEDGNNCCIANSVDELIEKLKFEIAEYEVAKKQVNARIIHEVADRIINRKRKIIEDVQRLLKKREKRGA